LLSFGALGSVAKTVTYSKWKGRQSARRHASPTDRRTPAQLAARGVFATGNAIWNLAPALAIAPWNRHAAGRVFSGQNAWQGRFMLDNAGQADLLALTFSPGAKGGLPPKTVVSTPGFQSITVDFTNPVPPIGWSLQSAIAAAIRDGNPETTIFSAITAGEDAPGAAQVVLSGLTPSVLYIVGGWLRWSKPAGSIAYGPNPGVEAVTPLATYVVNAVHFDGVNDYLLRGGDLTGAVNKDKALFSLWFNLTGGDSFNRDFLYHLNLGYRIRRDNTDKLNFNIGDPFGGQLWTFKSDDDFDTITNPGWNHLLVAFDGGASPVGQAYINDTVLARTDSVAPTTGDARWSGANHACGANITGATKLVGDLAEVYATSEYLDISIEANRRKFIDAAGKPADLGADGSAPTGTAPLIFFSGDTVDWHTNKGSGGGYTENGALTTAATSPSD
jgi:hypothetical protein